MAKRIAHVYVGLPHSGADLALAALEQHADALADAGVRQPAKSSDEMFRAAVEVRRDHRSWGLRRKDVEGVWSGICRRAFKGKDTSAVLVGHDLLAGASLDEIALLVDGLAGFAVHVTVTASAPDARVSLFPDDQDLADVLERWGSAVSSPDRIHVVVTDPADPGATWAALGRILGVDTSPLLLPSSLPLGAGPDVGALRLVAEASGSLASYDELVAIGEEWAQVVADRGYDVHGDLGLLVPAHQVRELGDVDAAPDDRISVLTSALSESLAEVSRLRERTRELEERNTKLEKKRSKLKRKLADAL